MKPTFFIPETHRSWMHGSKSRYSTEHLVAGDVYTLSSVIENAMGLEAATFAVRLEQIVPTVGKHGLILAVLDYNGMNDFTVSGTMSEESFFSPAIPMQARIRPAIDGLGRGGHIGESYFQAPDGSVVKRVAEPSRLIDQAEIEYPFGTLIRH